MSARASGIYPQLLLPKLPVTRVMKEKAAQGRLLLGAQAARSASSALTRLMLGDGLYIYPSEG